MSYSIKLGIIYTRWVQKNTFDYMASFQNLLSPFGFHLLFCAMVILEKHKVSSLLKF